MKNWWQSKTLGIVLVQSLVAVIGWLNGEMTVKGMVAAVLFGVVMALNRVYGTGTGIGKVGGQITDS